MVFGFLKWGLLALIVAVLATGGLLVSGAPKACVDRSSEPSVFAAAGLTAKWLAFTLAPVSVSVTETEATSMAAIYLRQVDVPVDDGQISFCPDGTAEATGKLKLLGLPTRILAKGTIDFSGPSPKIEFDDIKAGHLPSSIVRPAVEAILPRRFYYPPIPGRVARVVYADGRANVSGAR
jgi:hypothetical protein